MARRAASPPTEPPKRASARRSKAAEPISKVAPDGNRRRTLVAIRDRLAAETDETLWATHRRECMCTCGMGDHRLLVALVKELRSVEQELANLPEAEGESDLDRLADDLAERRAKRRSVSAG